MTSPTPHDLYFAFHAGKVQRFHTAPMIKPQSVGEHVYGVQVILHYLYRGDPPNDVLLAALRHDMAEYYLGDLPAPAKWRFPGLAAQYETAEGHLLQQEHACYNSISIPHEELRALKCADMLDLLLQSLYELQLGNQTALDLIMRGVQYLVDQNLIINRYAKEALSWLLKETARLPTKTNVGATEYNIWCNAMQTTLSALANHTETPGASAGESARL